MVENRLKLFLSFQLVLCICALATLAMPSANAADATPQPMFAHCNPGFTPCGPQLGCIKTVEHCCGDGTYCPQGHNCWFSGYTFCCPSWQYGTVDRRCVPIGYSSREAMATPTDPSIDDSALAAIKAAVAASRAGGEDKAREGDRALTPEPQAQAPQQ